MKVKNMNRFARMTDNARAISSFLRNAFASNPEVSRTLEETYVKVALSSRFGGN